MKGSIVLNRSDYKLVLIGPSAIEHCDSRAGACGDRFHREVDEAGLDKLLPGCVEQLVFQPLAAPPGADSVQGFLSHEPILERLAFLIKIAHNKRVATLLLRSDK